MKTKSILLLLTLIIFPFLGNTQTENKSERSLETFNSLIIGGYYKVTLHQGEPKIIIHAKESTSNKIITEVRNEVLQISNKPINKSKAISIDLYSNFIEDFDVSGAVMIISEEVQKPENLILDINGAASINLKVDTKVIQAKSSGASILKLSGHAEEANIVAKGASIIKTANLDASKSNIIISGSAGALVSNDKSYTSNIDAIEEGKNSDNDINATDTIGERTTYGVTYDGTSARAKFLGIHVDVDEDDETGEVRIGTHKWVYDSEGEVTHKRIKHGKFNGHWGGVGLGVNGYVNEKFVYELPEEYGFMDLLWQKSVNVDINLFEQNIQLSSDGNFGLVTGVGYSIYNYRFTKSFTVMQDSNYFSGLYNHGVNVKKSKIVTNFITVPILFEYQDNNPSPLTKHRWHMNVGAIFGLRVHTHQKTYFNETNKDYELRNPITNDIDAYATSPADPISKVHDDFHMSPFKLDASVRVGWGWINLYGNVSLVEMFNVGKGPKLYPFSVGIMLTSW